VALGRYPCREFRTFTLYDFSDSILKGTRVSREDITLMIIRNSSKQLAFKYALI